MLDDNEKIAFTVNDLKQYLYCRRIVYYQVCLPHVRPVTFKMEAGMRRHEDEQKRSMRRTMHLPEIENAQRLFDVPVQSMELGLSGQIDELLVFPDAIIPVDYKLAKRASIHYKVQLTAYAMMAEAIYQLPAKTGILYLIQNRDAVRVNIGKSLRDRVLSAIAEMANIMDNEYMPAPTEARQCCIDCEFRRFCNDV